MKARLLPIPNMYAKPNDEKAILTYAKETAGLKISKVILPCLRINSIIDFGQKKVCLSGKHTNADSLVSSLIQIRFSKSELSTIRSVSKFCGVLIKKAARGVDPFASDFNEKISDILGISNPMASLAISPAANEIRNKAIILTRPEEDALFLTLSKKLSSVFYENLGGPSLTGSLISSEEGKKAFAQTSTASRAVILSELLKMTMPCSAVSANLSLLGGPTISAKRHLGNYLSHCRIIAQSVTGYYDKVLWESK